MNKTIISIIIPVYNAEKYIDRCIDSIRSQSFSEFEVIIINDGSTDKTLDKCIALAQRDSRIKVFSKKNEGVSATRQYGLNRAIGQYIIHIDPDDWINPDMLSEMYNKAIEENADMVICDFLCEYAHTTQRLIQKPSSLNSSTVQIELFQHLHGSCCNKLTKKAIIEKDPLTSYPRDLNYCEDLYFNTLLLNKNIKVAYIPKAFYHYDRHINPNSIVKAKTEQDFNNDIFTYQQFDLLTQNMACHTACRIKFASLIIHRAFIGGYFSSQKFKSHCAPFCKLMLQSNLPLHIKFLYYLACIGLYKPTFHLFNTTKFILQKLRYYIRKHISN